MKKVLDRILELKAQQKTAAFARSIGLNQQTMDRYLKGREPPIGVIQKLCTVYEVSADWLLGLHQRDSSAHVSGDGNAVAVGTNAKAIVRKIAASSSACESCKFKKFAEAFKAIQTPG